MRKSRRLQGNPRGGRDDLETHKGVGNPGVRNDLEASKSGEARTGRYLRVPKSLKRALGGAPKRRIIIFNSARSAEFFFQIRRDTVLGAA